LGKEDVLILPRCTRTPAKNAGAGVVGRFAGAFSSSFFGLELIPSKWRYLVPLANHHQGADATGKASHWAYPIQQDI